MSLKSVLKLISRLLLLTVAFGFIGSCAENVSGRVEVVKSDLTTAIKVIAQPISSEIGISAKASSVTATVTYENQSALQVKDTFVQIAKQLNYDKQVHPSSDRVVICHHTEKARFLWLEVVHNQPLRVVLGASITGWQSDVDMCLAAGSQESS